MTKHYVLFYKPFIQTIKLPNGNSKVNEQNFQAGEGEIGFSYFQVVNNGIPADLYDIIHQHPHEQIVWEDFKRKSPTLANIVSEGLLQIGIRI